MKRISNDLGLALEGSFQAHFLATSAATCPASDATNVFRLVMSERFRIVACRCRGARRSDDGSRGVKLFLNELLAQNVVPF